MKAVANVGDERAGVLVGRDASQQALIDRTIPNARVLVSLRDPVERAYSHYLMMLNNGSARGSFLQEFQRGLELQDDRRVPLLRPDVGLYHDQVRRFRDIFGDARIKVLVFEEFMADVPGTLQQVLAFLGIERDLTGFTAPVYRQYSPPRRPLPRSLFAHRALPPAAARPGHRPTWPAGRVSP